MNYAIQLLAALGGSLGFAALFNLHGKKLVFSALGGLLAWAIYLPAEWIFGNVYLAAFTASMCLTLYAEVMARVHRTPVTVYLVTSAIPLIPGAALYRSVNYLMLRQFDLCISECIHTLLFAASMSAGITLTSLVFQILYSNLHAVHRGH